MQIIFFKKYSLSPKDNRPNHSQYFLFQIYNNKQKEDE